MIEQLAIKLHHTKVQELKIFNSSEDDNGNELDISFSNTFNESSKREFDLTFEIKIVHKDKKVFDIKYSSTFITNIDITEEFKNSHFPIVNAPAIAFPFVRAYISTLMTLSGYDSLILPTINFAEAFEKQQERLKLK